ncbi:MAG: hypothetical protein RJP96_14890 [Algiphilus sp.]|uniref:hypothetical protein n=2 Tax=Algiphilus sp. TaxID=1872431 RepID=UPI0032EF834B
MSAPSSTGRLMEQLTDIAHWADMLGRRGYASTMRQARDKLAEADTLRSTQTGQRQSDNARIAQLEQENAQLREKLHEAGVKL